MQATNRFILGALVFALAACEAPDDGSDALGDEGATDQAPIQAEATSAPSQDNTAATDPGADPADAVEVQPRIFGVGTSCSPNPCQNGGTCVDQWLGYTCRCPSGFTGTQCQTPTVVCQTYTQPAAGKCGGLYCGLTQTQLAARLSFWAACNQPSAFTCSNVLSRVSGICGREVKAANVLDSNEQLRPKVDACIAQRPELQGVSVSSTCTNCYTSYQLCVASNCLIECIAGDSPSCDTCQQSQGCVSQLYTCTGLPKP